MKHMEILRRKLVYELFIEQFIEMAKVSVKYRSLQQTMCLLKQAERICLLLCDDKFTDEAEKYRKLIEIAKQSVQTKVNESALQGPELPRRESLADREAIKLRYRPDENYSCIDSSQQIEEIPSDDDNDEIYNYHRSVVAQIHATSAENLARFQHMDEHEDDVDEITTSIDKLEANLNDYESETVI
jgi:hypothetical protein